MEWINLDSGKSVDLSHIPTTNYHSGELITLPAGDEVYTDGSGWFATRSEKQWRKSGFLPREEAVVVATDELRRLHTEAKSGTIGARHEFIDAVARFAPALGWDHRVHSADNRFGQSFFFPSPLEGGEVYSAEYTQNLSTGPGLPRAGADKSAGWGRIPAAE